VTLVIVRASRQAGLTAIEAVLSLAIMAILAIGFAQTLNDSKNDLMVGVVASRLLEVRGATDRYVKDNFSTLETSATAGPIEVALSSLISGDYLPAGYENGNPFGQLHRVYVRRRAAGVLETMVVTTGGRPMNIVDGGAAAMMLRANGGFVPIGSSDAVGAKGGWRTSIAPFVPGGAPTPSGNVVSYTLHRRIDGPNGALMRIVTGNPLDNRMSTSLDLAGNNLTGGGEVQTGSVRIGGQLVAATEASTLIALSGLSCAADEVITKSGSALACAAVAGTPSGAIAAFTGGCPAGWNGAAEFAGRVMVGSGSGYSVGEAGGADFAVLTENQMPRHRHYIVYGPNGSHDWEMDRTIDATVRQNSNSGGDTEYSMNGTPEEADRGNSGYSGDNAPFDNRQAYSVVNFCRKN
jgi:microcystin-dependent protein/type II secretory pathway pseudopilin PulG